MPIVRLNGLQKIYPGNGKNPPIEAVKKIDLEIQDREFMVLVGPSGCGKSTTLRMIAGLEEVNDGTIAIDDHIINELPPKDRDIAMVFQNYALYPHMTVFENIAFGLKLRKFPKTEIQNRVEEAARILGIEDLLNRKPKALSGGQRQRVAVGRAIVRKPKVFLFDEPLSNLDAKTRAFTRMEISKLHCRLDATMIYVTHDQIEAMTMGDRICVMNEGEIMQTANPLELYNKPANLFAAGFIGSPSMNFIKGRVGRKDGKVLLIEICTSEDVMQIELGPRLSSLAESHVGKELILGIRPENLIISPDKIQAGNGVDLDIEVIEPMGNETLLYLSNGATSVTARAASDSQFKIGEQLKVGFDLGHAHLFDPTTELSLS